MGISARCKLLQTADASGNRLPVKRCCHRFSKGDVYKRQDYIFAFGALGLSGLFSKSKNGLVKGYIVGVLGRYFFAFLSGMIFFGAYAADYGMSAPVYSLVYNGIYLSVEAVLTLIILYLPPVKKVMGQLKTMATQR